MKTKYISAKILFALLTTILFFNTAYSQLVNDFKVNDDIGSAYQNLSKVEVDTAGNFVVVWQDQRNISGNDPKYDVYFQRYNFRGEPQGVNYKINQVDSAAACPNVVMRKDGSFVVSWWEGVWVGQYLDFGKFYVRIFNKFGNPISNRIAISDSTHYYVYDEIAEISVNSLSEIIAVMTISPTMYDHPNIYLQKLDASGNKIGMNEKVNDDASLLFDQRDPDITIREDNSYIIVWDDNRLHNGAEQDIFMQKYYSNGQKNGINIKVNSDIPPCPHLVPKISSDSSGRFAVVWDDSRESSGSFMDVYCQFFNSDGSFDGSNFRVCYGFQWDRWRPAIKKRRDGYFVIGWADQNANGHNWCPFFVRYSNSNQVIGYQHTVTNFNPAQTKTFGGMTLWKDRIISTWTEYRNGNGDIFCNIISFTNPDSVISSVHYNNEIKSKKSLLSQNYPNPFNGLTKISYRIESNAFVRISIYNILGKEVTILVNGFHNTGSYVTSLSIDAINLSTGLYFYKIFTNEEFKEVKKLVIIK